MTCPDADIKYHWTPTALYELKTQVVLWKWKTCYGNEKHHVCEQVIPPPLPAQIARSAQASCRILICCCVALATRRGHSSHAVPAGGVTRTVTRMLAAGDVQDRRLDCGMWEITVCYLCTWIHILGQRLISDLLLQANKTPCSALEYIHVEKSLIKYITL